MRTTVLAAALSAAALSTAGLSAATLLAPAAAHAAPLSGACGPGELCLWEQPGFEGPRHLYELAGLDIESCVPLPPGTSAQAVVNRTGRPVTTYQSEECAETGEFETYPGGGTWVPQSPYRVRAFKVWES
ncbi:peptidase inhibitor family I36 protein [Streptomyces sp. NPDC000410]|uniref:peptidase inhibitor family I36 protein n=1 Tax=Streptomyces sp. NPDC000410 TaxID=3154254 RepID=UPI003325652B